MLRAHVRFPMEGHPGMQKRNVKSTAITGLGIILATATMVAAIARTNVAASSSAVIATDQGPQTAPGQQKKYKATRAIVRDTQTGELRLPTTEELKQTVDSLASLTHQDVAAAVATPTTVTGLSALNISPAAGVFVARPNEDGTMETQCVFTFEEAVAFLGIVEDIQ
jgi:hypothetical protein